jgi:hypothetical protein
MALTSIGFAQTKQVPKTLSYEKAVELAIKNSLDIKQIDRKLQKIETTNKELDKKSERLSIPGIDYPEKEDDWNQLLYSLEKEDKEKKLNEFSARYTKRMLEDTIRNLFHSIEFSVLDLQDYDQQIQLKQKELQIAKVRYSVGKISRYDYDLIKTSLEGMKRTKEQKRLELQKQKLELNKYLRLNNLDEYTLVSIPYQYQPITLTDAELNSHAVRASHTNMDVVAKENGISLQQLLIDQNLVLGNRKIQQEDVYIANTENLKLKEDIREGVKREYANLKLTEERIELLLYRKEVMKQELQNDMVRLKYGKISKFSIEEKKMQLSELERQYTESVKEYELAKIHFQNLYVSGSNL